MSENNGNNGHQQVYDWLPELIKIHGKKALGLPDTLRSLTGIFQNDPLGEWQDVEDILHSNKIPIPPLKEVIKLEIRKAIKEEQDRAKEAKRQAKQETKQQEKLGKLKALITDQDRYSFENGQMFFEGETIANFQAYISEDIIFDDELDQRREYEICGKIAGEKKDRCGRIRADEFIKSNWIENILGAGAAVEPRRFEHVRAAIKFNSSKRTEKTIFAHAGWRQDPQGWKFYHAGGAIGASGLIAADVEIDGLEMYCLPAPGSHAELAEAWGQFELLIECHSPQIVAPLLGAVLCAPVDKPRFSTFSLGETGFGKTTYNLLFLSLFGSAFVADEKAPADWEGTLFGHQVRGHKAKHLPLLIDEYVPKSSKNGEKMRHVCTEMLRSQGNLSGRTAGTVHGGLRKERFPRGLIMATGEDVPDGRSLRARVVIVEFDRKMDEQSKAKLSPLQHHARSGLFAKLGAAYLQWLAAEARIGTLLDQRQASIQALRLEWQEHLAGYRLHERTPSNFASLERAWDCFLRFAIDIGLADEEKAESIKERMLNGLKTCAVAQAPWLTDADPHSRFIHLIGVALSSGAAHLAPADEYQFVASEYESYGWRGRETTNGRVDKDGKPLPYTVWQQTGKQIGWADDSHIWLMPTVARQVADSLLPNGQTNPVSQRQFDCLLRNAGLVIAEPSGRKVATTRKKFAATQHEVYCFKLETLLGKDKPELDTED